MSNKMLITLIVVIVAVSAAAAGYLYWQNNKPLVNVPLNSEDTKEAQTVPPSQETAQTPPAAAGECQRLFDANKLKNDQVSISGRQVEMDVKGFGKIVLDLYDKDAPKAVENFLRLVNSGYYNCLTFHRVAKNFVIQGGDPNGNGTGGQSAFGGAFADELNPNTPSYKVGYVKGVLAMANSGPNTNGSQFFIMLADVELPHGYTIFGKVTAGLDVVDKIGQVEITPQMGPTDGAPKQPVVMQSVKIIK